MNRYIQKYIRSNITVRKKDRTIFNVPFLGLLLDEHFSYHSLIENVSNKVFVGIFILRTLLVMSCEILLSSYYGIVFPYLSYAVPNSVEPFWCILKKNEQFYFYYQTFEMKAIPSFHDFPVCSKFPWQIWAHEIIIYHCYWMSEPYY